MRFWDTSALVPLLVSEVSSDPIRELLREDSAILAWWGTQVEIVSALARAHRHGRIDPAGLRHGLGLLRELLGAASIIQPSQRIAEYAERLLVTHDLRAADALQLAAAMIATQNLPRGFHFVSLDQRLRSAAEREGFTPLPETL